MNKRGKQVLLFSVIALIAVALISILAFNLISAAIAPITLNVVKSTVTPASILEGVESSLNFTITEANTSAAAGVNNITGINITLPAGVLFTNLTASPKSSAGGNFSSAGYNFTNTTAARQILNFENETATKGLVLNQTTKYFWFNVTVATPGTYNITINVSYGSSWNLTNITLTVNDTTAPLVQQYNSTQAAQATVLIGNVSVNINNTYYNFTQSLNFSCNMTDNYQLASVTLFVVGTPFGPIYTNSTPEIGGKAYNSVIGTYNQTNFTQRIAMPGTYRWWCMAADAAGNIRNSTINLTFTMNAFSFSGWVQDKTFTNVSGANVSIYEYIMGAGSPPLERIIKSTTTGADGNFTLININNSYSSMNYKVKITLNNSEGNVTEVGPSLPPMPREALMFSMDGGTFYLQAATTLKLYAYANLSHLYPDAVINTSLNQSALNFGYEVVDQALGFPVVSDVQGEYSTVSVVVPANRSYTVMFVRDPYSFHAGSELCIGPSYMNRTDCPSPPASVQVTSTHINDLQNTTEINSTAYLIIINKSLSFSQYNLTGCLNIIGNTTSVNVTDIKAKLVPWEGFLPPIKGEVSDFDPTSTQSFKIGLSGSGLNAARGCGIGAYNLTLMGSASGINWFIEAYAGNTTDTVYNGYYYAAFQNLTMLNEGKTFNLTLRKLLGGYSPSGEINTSKIEVAIMDSNGTAPQSAHVEVYVKNPVFGTMHYVIETLTNGKFNISIINDTTEARVRVYSNMYAPKEQKINFTANRTNVTLYSFRPQVMEENATIAYLPTNKTTGSRIRMKFMKYSDACNVYTPPASCQIGTAKTGNFDPLQAMMAGKSNLWIKTNTNVTLYFINVDMLASGPPDALMNENASTSSLSASTLQQLWTFGSMAPDVYDKVMIGIPYNSSISESWSYSINLSLLYDSDMRVIWNETANTSAQLPSDYSDFSLSFFSGGVPCSTDSTTSTTSGSCYMNKTDNTDEGNSGYFWITMPHFSTTTDKISGGAPVSVSGAGSPRAGAAAEVTGTVYDTGTLTATVSKEIGVGDGIKFKIEAANHTVKLTGLTATSAAVKISSLTITKTLMVGKAENVDLDGDGTNEISVTLESVNLATMRAKLTITPLIEVAPEEAAAPAAEIKCGDGICQSSETCSTCAADCACPTGKECVEGVCQEKAVTPVTPAEKPTISKTLIYGGIIAVVVIILIILLLMPRKK
jgi:hypothetical protein